MSLDDLHSCLGAPNGRPATEIELDASSLGSVVADSEDIHADDDSELLARLESADTVAGGMETRLDEILDTLDELLTSLEPKDNDGPQEAGIPRPDSQIDSPPPEQS